MGLQRLGLSDIVENMKFQQDHLLVEFCQEVIFMSGTLQTAIAFPVVFLGIVTLVSAGPVLYREVMESAVFQTEAVRASVANTNSYSVSEIRLGSEDVNIVCTSPERLHFYMRTVEDIGTILYEGAVSP
jgi:hypothetical protein